MCRIDCGFDGSTFRRGKGTAPGGPWPRPPNTGENSTPVLGQQIAQTVKENCKASSRKGSSQRASLKPSPDRPAVVCKRSIGRREPPPGPAPRHLFPDGACVPFAAPDWAGGRPAMGARFGFPERIWGKSGQRRFGRGGLRQIVLSILLAMRYDCAVEDKLMQWAVLFRHPKNVPGQRHGLCMSGCGID
jgi:hypothetical protein